MSIPYSAMTDEQLAEEIAHLETEAGKLRALDLSLDMTRGKPSPEQVDLVRPILDVLNSKCDLTEDGEAAANYGIPNGLRAARRVFARILDVDPDNVVIGGSSSLNIEYDCITHAFVKGVRGNTPWHKLDKVKFLCPSPGYDRHFGVSEHFGIENVPVRMTLEGPDMDEVARLVEGDETVKGIWCVPKYQNPMGITFSDEVVRRMAALRPAAPDFRIYWDNAYIVHDVNDTPDQLLNIFKVLEEEGREGLVYEFASTSKVTFAGCGMGCVVASKEDLDDLNISFSKQRVSTDKLTQLRHARYLPDMDKVRELMRKHADLVEPRFEMVQKKLSEGLEGLEDIWWTEPNGGYFVSFEGPEGTAKEIVSMAADLGVKMTAAGATWPYGVDPLDSNIRIAPTYPSMDELIQALDVFVICVRTVCARKEAERRRA